jgi:hypothetical protein
MAEQSPVLSSTEPSKPDVYRPLSNLALAAIVLAGLYALLIAAFSVVALANSWPLFLNLWNLLVPITALVLAYVARQRIRNSEGVLSGQSLTTWAWWLSVLFGLGYAAYYFGTYLAVTWKAEDFARVWFEKIRQGKTNEAFWDTLDPIKRKSDNPSDPDWMFTRHGMASGPRSKGMLSIFQDFELVRLLENKGPDVEIKFLGVKDWEYDKGGYRVEENYRITTPEGQFNSFLALKSTDSKELEGLAWQIEMQHVPISGHRELSPLGLTLDKWRQDSRRFANEWIMKRSAGELAGFLDTRPASQRADLERELHSRETLAALGAGLAAATAAIESGLFGPVAWLQSDRDLRLRLTLPGYAEYTSGELVKADRFMAVRTIRSDVVRTVKQFFHRPSHVVFQRPAENRGRVTVVDVNEGPVQFFHDVVLEVYPKGTTAGGAKYTCDAALIVEGDAGPANPSRQPAWRIVGLELIRGFTPPAPPGPGGPGAQPGP